MDMPDTESRYVVLVRLKTKDGEEEAFKGEMREVFAKIRREPACVEITGHQDRGDPTRFMLFELWTSAEAFVEFESGREYMQDYLARAGELWAEPRDLTAWEVVA